MCWKIILHLIFITVFFSFTLTISSRGKCNDEYRSEHLKHNRHLYKNKRRNFFCSKLKLNFFIYLLQLEEEHTKKEKPQLTFIFRCLMQLTVESVSFIAAAFLRGLDPRLFPRRHLHAEHQTPRCYPHVCCFFLMSSSRDNNGIYGCDDRDCGDAIDVTLLIICQLL